MISKNSDFFPPREKKNHRIMVCVGVELAKRIGNLARARRTTASEAIRLCLEYALEKIEAEKVEFTKNTI